MLNERVERAVSGAPRPSALETRGECGSSPVHQELGVFGLDLLGGRVVLLVDGWGWWCVCPHVHDVHADLSCSSAPAVRTLYDSDDDNDHACHKSSTPGNSYINLWGFFCASHIGQIGCKHLLCDDDGDDDDHVCVTSRPPCNFYIYLRVFFFVPFIVGRWVGGW